MSIIQISNLTKKYKVNNIEQTVIDNQTYQFESGCMTTITGDSGCGKTSLLNIIGCLDTDYDGDVLIDGTVIEDASMYRRSKVSFIYQENNLIEHLNLIQNISLSLPSHITDRDKISRDLLEKVGLKAHMKKSPRQLSGGEKKRVAIARALARGTDILLCDEPTSNLDGKTKNEIMALITKIFKGKTIILVTHDTDLAHKYSDDVLNLNNGVVTKTHSKPTSLRDQFKDELPSDKEKSSFDGRFSINLLSDTRKVFNSLILFVVISAMLLFSIGVIRGAENKFDDYLMDNFKTDILRVRNKGMSFKGIKNNIEEFNLENNNQIIGFSADLYRSLKFAVSGKEFGVYLNSFNQDILDNIKDDITVGRPPIKDNEVLFSEGAAIKTIFEFNDYLSLDNNQLRDLYQEVTSYDDKTLLDELKKIQIDSSSQSGYTNEIVYDETYEVVGLIDDYKYMGNDNFYMEILTEKHDVYGKYFNDNRYIRVTFDGSTSQMLVNDNIYIYESELLKYIDKVYIGENSYKFQGINLFTTTNDLDSRKIIFDNFLLFKPLFYGTDYVSNNRATYYDDMKGYKIAIISTSIILFLLALIEIVNNIRVSVKGHRKNIGIYRSLGYSSKNIKSMFLKEGWIISGFASLAILGLWSVFNLLLNERLTTALDASQVLSVNRIIHFDLSLMLGLMLLVISVFHLSIRMELRKVDVIKLMK